MQWRWTLRATCHGVSTSEACPSGTQRTTSAPAGLNAARSKTWPCSRFQTQATFEALHSSPSRLMPATLLRWPTTVKSSTARHWLSSVAVLLLATCVLSMVAAEIVALANQQRTDLRPWLVSPLELAIVPLLQRCLHSVCFCELGAVANHRCVAADRASDKGPAQTGKGHEAPPGKVEGYNVLFVGNIPWEVDKAAVEELFSSFSPKFVRMFVDEKLGKHRGFAHVHFSDSPAVDKCGPPSASSCRTGLHSCRGVDTGSLAVQGAVHERPVSDGERAQGDVCPAFCWQPCRRLGGRLPQSEGKAESGQAADVARHVTARFCSGQRSRSPGRLNQMCRAPLLQCSLLLLYTDADEEC